MMLSPSHCSNTDDWAVMRARMLRETELFLEEGLRHPESHRRIPAIPVGSGRFPRGFADAYWSQILATS